VQPVRLPVQRGHISAIADREAAQAPIKSASYAGEINTLMLDIVGGLGDEYSDTGPNGRQPHQLCVKCRGHFA
jgi:hypothetical protein